MPKDGVTINELSKMANVTVRTIRFYTDEGVLDEPAGRDRYARYTRKHFLQLCAAKVLKEKFLPLRVIRDQMASLSESELERMVGPISPDIEERFSDVAVEEYGQFSKNTLQTESPGRMRPRLAMEQAVLNSVDIMGALTAPQAFSYPSEYAEQPLAAQRRAVPANVGDVWHRIVISPTMELHVREDGMNEMGEIRRILAALRRSK